MSYTVTDMLFTPWFPLAHHAKCKTIVDEMASSL